MSEITQITGRQIAAGRVLVGMGQDELAASSRISVPTLRRMEASTGPAAGLVNNVSAVRTALETAGVEFIPENGGGAGVRLRKRATALGSDLKPVGPATDFVEVMDKAISGDRARLASVKETGEEVPQAEWERFEAAAKKPSN